MEFPLKIGDKVYPPILFDLHYEATRLSLAYAYDHLPSLSFTRTNLEPYQVEAVYKTLNTYKHRILLADDVGLGKTIETGMILIISLKTPAFRARTALNSLIINLTLFVDIELGHMVK
ncbi:MAG: hypothetical protein QMC83_08875 [Thermodesulfovibrionales bacterium]|nr:hypothetical protein [Thermodesulfovibrionales bacterium]